MNPVPNPDLGLDKKLCRNDSLTLTPGNFISYRWQDNTTAPSFTETAVGKYWVQVTNNFNCVGTDTFTLAQMMEPPSNFLKETDSICSYGSAELLPTKSYSSFNWSTGATTKSISVKSPGIYRLAVTDYNGCTGSDSTAIFLKQCMWESMCPQASRPMAMAGMTCSGH